MKSGTLIDGRFAIDQRVAVGGMGAVYRAKDVTTGAWVAIKVLRDVAEDLHARLGREALALSEIQHPRIVRYVSNGFLEDGAPYLAMEWIEGETLSARLRRESVSTSQAMVIARGIAEALGYVHERGLVHRDVKPSNVILRDGSVNAATLVDFGLVRARADVSLTRTGTIVGTPTYMSPEQARGQRDVGAAADVFALGCVLFRCLTGRDAFQAQDPLAVLAKVLLDEPPRASELVPELGPRIDALLARMLVKDPAKRLANGNDVVVALDALGIVDDAAPLRPSMPPRLGLSERKLHTLVLAATRYDRNATLSRGSTLSEVSKLVERLGGARYEVLANGSLAVTVQSADSAKEQAVKAAACALDIAQAVNVPVVVVTGHTVTGPDVDVTTQSDAFDRAATLLRAAGAQRTTLVDETTAGLLADRYVVAPCANGFELRREVRDADSGRTVLGRAMPFVGRERELATLSAVADESERDGVARAVLVTGPPGIGKSRLRRELVLGLRSRWTIFSGGGDPLVRGAPGATLARAIAQSLQIVPIADALTHGKLGAYVREQLPDDDGDRVADFLAELLMLDAGPPSSRRIAARADPVLMHEQVRRALCDFLTAECAKRPVVFVIEDLQWVDALTIRLLDAALEALREAPFLVVAFARSEISETHPKLWSARGVVPMAIAALSRRAATSFVCAALPSASGDVVTRVVSQGGGNPLFLEELVRAENKGRGAEAPATVLAMVESRLAHLAEETRRVMRAASIFGGAFSVEGVAAILSDDATQIRPHTEQLIADEICMPLRPPGVGGDLAFRDALVREAAYGMLTTEDARLGHRLAAEWLERAQADLAQVAEHYARGDEPARAVAPLIQCARRALDASDFTNALALAARAASLGPSRRAVGECALVAAEAHRWLGETALAFSAAGEALAAFDVASIDTQRFTALGMRAYGASYLGRAPELDAVYEELLRCDVPPAHTRAFVFAASQAASSLVIVGRLAEGERLLDKARPYFALFQDDPAVVTRFLQAKVACASHAGDLELLLETATAARINAAKAGDDRAAILHAIGAGFARVQLGEYEEALAIFEWAREHSTRHVTNRRSAMQNAGYALLRLGRTDEARALEQAVLSEVGADASPRLLTLAHACLALIELQAGDLEKAERHARAAAQKATGAPQAAYAEAALAEVLFARGAFEESIASADRALAIMARVGGYHFAEGRVVLARALALEATGQVALAHTALENAEHRILERAQRLSPGRRATFLAIDEHRRTLERARS